MASLVILDGPNAGQRFSLSRNHSLIGRQPDTAIYLDQVQAS
jgi:hypothetical protein